VFGGFQIYGRTSFLFGERNINLSFSDFNTDSLFYPPTFFVREADKEMVVSLVVIVIRNDQGLVGDIFGFSPWDLVFPDQYKGIDGFFWGVCFTVGDFCTVGVLVEIVMDVDAEGAQFRVVCKPGLEVKGFPNVKGCALAWKCPGEVRVDDGFLVVNGVTLAREQA